MAYNKGLFSIIAIVASLTLELAPSASALSVAEERSLVNGIQAADASLPSGVANPKWTVGSLLSEIFYGSSDGAKNGMIKGQYVDVAGLNIWTQSGSNAYYTGTGNVGIGTSNPARKLEVSGNFQAKWVYSVQGSSDTDLGIWVRNQWTGDFVSVDNGTSEIFRIKNNGNVGIGTSSPTTIFHVKWWANQYGIFERSNKQLYVNANWADGNSYGQIAMRWTDWMGLSLSSKDTSPEYLFVSNSGNVGIGTASPSTKLHVYNGSSGGTPYGNSFLTVENSGRSIIQLLSPNASDSYLMFGSPAAANRGYVWYQNSAFATNPDQMVFYTSGNFNFSGGNVGIGTSSPAYKLHVYGGNTLLQTDSTFLQARDAAWTNRFAINNDFGSILNFYGYDSAWFNFMSVNNAGTKAVSFNASNVGIGTTSPATQMAGTTGLGIYHSLYPAVSFKNDTSYWLWYGASSTLRMWNASAGEIMAATTAGNVGIGTTSPSYKLDVNGDVINNGWYRSRGATGLYNESYDMHIWPLDGNSNYWGSRSNYGWRYQDRSGNNRGYTYFDGSGFWLLSSDGAWRIRTNPGYQELIGVTYESDTRSSIYYDRDNTGYYVDPNNTSNVNNLCLNGSCRSSWPSGMTCTTFDGSSLELNIGNGYRYMIHTNRESIDRRCKEVGYTFGTPNAVYTYGEWCMYSNAATASYNLTNGTWSYGGCANGYSSSSITCCR